MTTQRTTRKTHLWPAGTACVRIAASEPWRIRHTLWGLEERCVSQCTTWTIKTTSIEQAMEMNHLPAHMVTSVRATRAHGRTVKLRVNTKTIHLRSSEHGDNRTSNGAADGADDPRMRVHTKMPLSCEHTSSSTTEKHELHSSTHETHELHSSTHEAREQHSSTPEAHGYTAAPVSARLW